MIILKKIIIALFFVTVLFCLSTETSGEVLIPSNAIRFRIIASSNSLEDQDTKIKIRKEIERSYLPFNGNKVSITVSIGISLKKSDDSLWQSIEEADKALYESKATGKNKVTIYQKDKIKRMT